MKPVTWRFWTLTVSVIIAYGLLGIPFHKNDAAEYNLYKYGLGAVCIIALVYVAVYTFLGLTGSAKWWRTNMGSNFVLLALGVLPIAGPLTWVFWVDHGQLTSSWLAWIEVGGPPASALLYARQCSLWLYAAKQKDEELAETKNFVEQQK